MNLSIILPVYNVEPYLDSCLKSIFNMNFNFELIAINDGSTDGSLPILRKYESENKNMKVIDQENSGPSVARNVGLEEAIGNYVYYFDSDDILLKKFEIINFMSEMRSFDILTFNAEVFDTGKTNNIQNKQRYIEPLKLFNNFKKEILNDFEYINYNGLDYLTMICKKEAYTPVVWRKIYRKSFLEEYNINFHPNIAPGEDDLHFFQTLLCNPNVAHFDQIVLSHRIRSTSIMGYKDKGRNYRSYNLVLSELIQLKKKHLESSLISKNINWIINVFFRRVYSQNPTLKEAKRIFHMAKKYHISLNLKTRLKLSLSVFKGKTNE